MIAEYECKIRLWVKHFERNWAGPMALPEMCLGGAISAFVYWFLDSKKKKKKIAVLIKEVKRRGRKVFFIFFLRRFQNLLSFFYYDTYYIIKNPTNDINKAQEIKMLK